MKPNDMKGVMVAVLDARNRPLYMVRINGQVVYYRYHDMSADDRGKIVRFAQETKKRGFVDEYEEDELLDFLDFKNDRKICG